MGLLPHRWVCDCEMAHEGIWNCLLARVMKTTVSRKASWGHLDQNSSPHDLSWGYGSQAPHSPSTTSRRYLETHRSAEARLHQVGICQLTSAVLHAMQQWPGYVWPMSMHVGNEGGGCYTLGDRMTEPRNHAQTRKPGLPNFLLLKHCF